MKLKGILFSFLLSLNLYGAPKYVDGEGRFYSKDEDSLSFVKKQLLFSAFRDVLTKEMDKLGLDTGLFWEKYEKKFEEYFDPIKEGLKKKYRIDDPDKKPTASQKNKYSKVLRLKRLNLKTRYGRLNKAIKKYIVRKMTRSTQVPNARYIRVQALVDKKSLHDIYLSFTNENENRYFQSLYVSTHWNLKGMSWTDAGVEVGTDFTSVVNDHWKDFLKQNLKNNVDRIVVANETQLTELNNFMKLPKETLQSLIEEAESGDEVEVSQGDLKDSLWLKVQFTIEKAGENEKLEKRSYRISGEYVLFDLINQEIVDFQDFEIVQKEYSTMDEKKLSSNLASLVYRTPVESFKRVGGKLAKLSGEKNHILLEVDSFETVNDLIHLQKWLSLKGITKQFKPRLVSYASGKAKFILEFKGSANDVKSFLNGLNQNEIQKGLVFQIKNSESPFNLTLVKTVKTVEESIEPSVKSDKEVSL